MIHWIKAGFNHVLIPTNDRQSFNEFISKFNSVTNRSIVPSKETTNLDIIIDRVMFFDDRLKTLYSVSFSDVDVSPKTSEVIKMFVWPRKILHSGNIDKLVNYFNSPDVRYIFDDMDINSLPYGPSYVDIETYSTILREYNLPRPSTEAVRITIDVSGFSFDIQLGSAEQIMFESLREYQTIYKITDILRINKYSIKAYPIDKINESIELYKVKDRLSEYIEL